MYEERIVGCRIIGVHVLLQLVVRLGGFSM